jgi:hypothetical protein
MSPLIRDMLLDAVRGIPAANISRRFHKTVDLTVSVCNHIRRSMQVDAMVLSGGCSCTPF